MQDPMFFNKLAAAVLAALLIFFGLPQIASALRGGHHGGHGAQGHPFPQFPIAFTTATAVEAGPVVNFATLLASADAAVGERRIALCKSCHTLEKGGANGTGPNLWGVVGRAVGGQAGFKYSGALQGAGGEWTFERLSAYLENSQAYLPGTAMIQKFPKAEQRAEMIAYLNTLSDAPLALPEPAAEPPAPAAETPSPTDAPVDAAAPPAEPVEGQ